MKNIMDEYIEFTEKNIRKYMKMIFNSYYDEEIVSEYIKTYVNIRYYNIYNRENISRPFYLKIMDELDDKSKILQNKYNKEKEKIIKNTKQVFSYILFFDNVRKVENFKKIKSISEVIENLVIIREKEFGIKNKEDFKEKLYKTIVDDMLNKDIYLDNFSNDDFHLDFKKLDEKKEIYYVKLEHDIKMPMQFSNEAVEKVFNKSIIAEDKLEIEYILLSIVSIKDILSGNFNDIYITEFESTLLNKKQKMERILLAINNQALQEKIYLNISYEKLMENKEQVLEYVKKGYNFAVTLDNSVKYIEDVEKLKMFKILIIPKNLKISKEIKKSHLKEKYIVEK